MPKDDLWWIHPAYRGRKTLGAEDLRAFPQESLRWARSAREDTAPVAGRDASRGPFAELYRILFMLNGHRPGPVPGWYVVVNTVAESEWCVGQLCADAGTPLLLFEDLRFASQQAARAAAGELRKERGRREKATADTDR